MKTQRIRAKQVQIDRIKERIMALGELRPGSLSRQYNICGNPTCRCKDPDNPKKHGPYYNLSFTRNGKSRTEFVREGRVAQVRAQIGNYKKLKELVSRWIDLSLEITELRKES
jgi:hypothetical protein